MLLYIHKIEYCEAKHLKSAIFLPDYFKVILKEVMPWREVPIVGLAALETGDELDNGVRIHTQKLTATLETEYVFPQSPIEFLSPQSTDRSTFSALLTLRIHLFSRTRFCRQMQAKTPLRN
jgi:hypothetical protein